MNLLESMRDLSQAPELLDDPRRLEALLRDYHPEDHAHVSAVLESVRQGLAATWVADPAPLAEAKGRQAGFSQLCTGGGLSAEMAWWVVEAWQRVLGVGKARRNRQILRRRSLIRDRPGTLGEHLL